MGHLKFDYDQSGEFKRTKPLKCIKSASRAAGGASLTVSSRVIISHRVNSEPTRTNSSHLFWTVSNSICADTLQQILRLSDANVSQDVCFCKRKTAEVGENVIVRSQYACFSLSYDYTIEEYCVKKEVLNTSIIFLDHEDLLKTRFHRH